MDLALHHGADPHHDRMLLVGLFEQLQPGQKRGKRIAELVTESREEFVLALVCDAKQFFGPRTLSQMAANLVLTVARAKSRANRAEKRGYSHRPLEQRDVAERADGFSELR